MSFSRCFKLLTTLLAVLIGLSFAASGKKIASGKFRYSVGEVFLHRNGETLAVKTTEQPNLKKAKNVREGDDIETLIESEVIVALPDGSSFNVQENTIVSITKLSFEDGENHFATEVKKGNLSFDVQKQAGKSTFKFKTGTATAAIRGTSGTIGQSPNKKKVFALKEGILDINFNGQNYTITEGQTAIGNDKEMRIININGSGDPSFMKDLLKVIDEVEDLDSLIKIIEDKDQLYTSVIDSLKNSIKCTYHIPDTTLENKIPIEATCPAGVKVGILDERVMSDGTPIHLTFEVSSGSFGMKKIPITCQSDSVSFQCAQLSAYYTAREIKATDTDEHTTLKITTPSPFYVCNSSSVTVEGSFDPNVPDAKLFVKIGNYQSEDLVPRSANGQFSHTVTITDNNGLWNEDKITVEYTSDKHKETATLALNVDKTCKAVNLLVPQVRFNGYDSLTCKAQVSILNQQNDFVFYTTSVDNAPKNSIYINDGESSLGIDLTSGIHTYEFTVEDQAANKHKITKELGCYPNINGASIILDKGPEERLRVPPPPRGFQNTFHRTMSFRIDKLPQSSPIYIQQVKIQQEGKPQIILRGTDLQTNRIDQDIELMRSKTKTHIDITVILKNGTTLQATKTYEVR